MTCILFTYTQGLSRRCIVSWEIYKFCDLIQIVYSIDVRVKIKLSVIQLSETTWVRFCKNLMFRKVYVEEKRN